MMSYDWKLSVLILGVTLLIWAYLKIKRIYTYFEKRGIPYAKPTFLLGSDVRGALARDCLGESFDRIYKALGNEKYGGSFVGIIPAMVIKDPEYVNKILTTSFEHFHDRPFLIDEKTNPLEAHLFFLKGNKWKYLRNKLSPVFTSGKLKYMYPQMEQCSQQLSDYLIKMADGKDIDLQEALAKYSTDVIGSTAFGLEPEALKKPDSEFRAMGRRFFAPTLRNAVLFFLRFAAPQLLVALKIRTTEKMISDYFRSMIQQVFEFRRKNSASRNDFVQLSLQLQEKGYIEVDSGELDKENDVAYNEKSLEKFEITDDLLAAQSFVFFLAGFETTSMTMYFLIYMLSLYRDIQDRVRDEARKAKNKYGQFNYEAVKDLPLLDNCISETLRLFPPVAVLNRVCNKEYILPDGKKIEKGMQVMIPIFSLQRDPQYFPQPECFNPDRFDTPPQRGTYAPFGDGPRICIGKRFALVEIKMTVCKLLDKFCIEKSPLGKNPIEFAASMTLAPKNPLYVRLTKLQT